MEEGPAVVGEIGGAIRLFSDGSHVRLQHPIAPPSQQFSDGVASKDVVINPETGVWARIFVPETTTDVKPPLLFYFHGGGFSVCSTAWPEFHLFLNRLCKTAGVVIVSVDYRLAPEHRLPAAYDDCMEAVQWAPRSGDEWLSPSTVDFGRCFLAGESAGANIVHHVALRLANAGMALLTVRGLVVIHPFFGGEEMVGLEKGMEAEEREKLRRFCEMVWKMCLPVGSDREHPYCNPLTTPLGTDVKLPPVMVAVAGKDILRRRGVMYYEYLRGWGKVAEVVEEEGGVHAFHVAQPASEGTNRLIHYVCDFVHRV